MSDIKLFSTGKSGTREFSVKYVHTVRYLQTRNDKGLATGLRKGHEFDFEEL